MPREHRHNILIFDSGIGGLSINDEIRAMIPNTAITYVADNRVYPYGTLSEQALIERTTQLFPSLIARFQPEAMVIACNSASTLVLEHLRSLSAIPVIGVVPAIKPAAQQSTTQVIGLLATPGTVRRAYTDRLIQTFAAHCEVIRLGSRELVDLAEQKLRGESIDLHHLRDILMPFLAADNLDTVVLGCTHFPFLKQEIQQVLGSHIRLIDSGRAIAKRTAYIIETLAKSHGASHANGGCFIFTEDHHYAHQLCPHLKAHGFSRVEFINH